MIALVEQRKEPNHILTRWAGLVLVNLYHEKSGKFITGVFKTVGACGGICGRIPLFKMPQLRRAIGQRMYEQIKGAFKYQHVFHAFVMVGGMLRAGLKTHTEAAKVIGTFAFCQAEYLHAGLRGNLRRGGKVYYPAFRGGYGREVRKGLAVQRYKGMYLLEAYATLAVFHHAYKSRCNAHRVRRRCNGKAGL